MSATTESLRYLITVTASDARPNSMPIREQWIDDQDLNSPHFYAASLLREVAGGSPFRVTWHGPGYLSTHATLRTRDGVTLTATIEDVTR